MCIYIYVHPSLRKGQWRMWREVLGLLVQLILMPHCAPLLFSLSILFSLGILFPITCAYRVCSFSFLLFSVRCACSFFFYFCYEFAIQPRDFKVFTLLNFRCFLKVQKMPCFSIVHILLKILAFFSF
jgi:hypothetical protein